MDDIVYALYTETALEEETRLLAARNTGLYRSTDGGKSWQNLFDSMKLDAPLPALAIALNPELNRGHEIYVGVPGGIAISENGGENWKLHVFRSPQPIVSAIAVSPALSSDGILLVATVEDGVFRSADKGYSWSIWNFGLTDLRVYCMALSPDFVEDEILFVGTESGIFRSTNGGRAWREIPFPMESAPVNCIALPSDFADSGTLFAGTEANGLFISDNAGNSWNSVNIGPTKGAVNQIIIPDDYSQRGEILCVFDHGLFQSLDFGETWHPRQGHEEIPVGITCATAPTGLGPDSNIILGLQDGNIISV